MRAAVYARYSSDNQRPASIEDQVRKCRESITERRWQEVASYSDAEVSGTVAQRRTGYQQMLADAKRGRFDVLVVDELSRLTRDPEELARLRKQLRFQQIGLVALGDGLDTIAAPGAAGAIIAIKGLINESELEANAYRSRRGLEGRVLAGLHAGGAPYGYRTRPVHADRAGDPAGTGQVVGHEYVIHEAEADVVRRIFELYAGGMSPRSIAALLNGEGVPPPAARWRNRKGVRLSWSAATIAGARRQGTGILNNPKYAGRLIWNRSTWPRDPDQDGKQVRRELPKDRWVVLDHPGLRIVPQELWDAAKARQRALGTGSSIPGTHKRNQRLLSGLLICGKCGARLTLRGGNTYACAAHRDRGDAVCDSTVIVNARAAEQALLEVVTDVLYGEDLLSGIAERVRSKMVAVRQQQSDGGEQSSIQEQLAQVEQRIQNLADSIEQMGPLEDLKARFAQACNRREGLRADLALLQSNTSETDLSFIPDAVHAYAQRLPALLESGRMEEVKEGLISLVSRIEAYEAPDLANGKPGARLLFQGNLVGTVDLLGGKVKIVNSPGGLLPPLRFQPPPRRIKLYLLRGRGSGRDAAEPRRAATHG